MAAPRLKIDIPFATNAEVGELVRLFESCELPYARWTHGAHIAVAAVYLNRFSLDEATIRARHFINQYNVARGIPPATMKRLPSCSAAGGTGNGDYAGRGPCVLCE